MTWITGPWVYVFAGENSTILKGKTPGFEGKKFNYEVREIIPVSGENISPVNRGWNLLRLETEKPLPQECSEKSEWRGVARHLQYTDAELRKELQERSAGEYPASDRTMAVFIPIRKSAAWWALAQDERQAHFQKKAGRNHAAIGMEFASKIYRKLYHSRYFENLPGYDFLTYFEFKEEDSDTFRALLNDLRDVEQNPEWKFVEMETEIWTVKK